MDIFKTPARKTWDMWWSGGAESQKGRRVRGAWLALMRRNIRATRKARMDRITITCPHAGSAPPPNFKGGLVGLVGDWGANRDRQGPQGHEGQGDNHQVEYAPAEL